MKRLLPLLAAALAGAGLLALAGALTAPGTPEPTPPTTWSPPDRAYAIAAPSGWQAVAQGAGGAALKRRDGRGLIVIRRRGPVATPMPALAKRLTARLDRDLRDFKLVRARVASFNGREVLVYTFARPRAGTVQSIVVAPANRAAYTLDAVAAGDAPEVARQVGGMIRSFRAKAV